MAPITVSAFYKFTTIADPAALRNELAARAVHHNIKGTILLAEEGINATIAGRDPDVRAILSWLRDDGRFPDLVSKESYASAPPFQRMKVKLKREIVTLGVEGLDSEKGTGTYVKPEDWNALISNPGVVLIDTRNLYEVGIGSFPNAIDPGTRTFTEFPAFVKNTLDPEKHKKVAMFCTGGIRCEKASAFMLSLGFPEVYHLEGGILKYLETVPEDQSLWQGECFVFDERVAVGQGVAEGTHTMCRACGFPVGGSKETAAKPSGGPATCTHCGASL